MKQGQSFLSAVLTELNRRKVLRTVGAYAVGVFVVLQLMDFGQGGFHEKFGITENDLESAGIHL